MSFDAIIGQGRAVAALRRAIRSERVAHAYVFAGHEGVGKMTTALAFARALVCSAGGDDACGQCPACRKAAHGMHPDVHVIAPEGKGRQIKIEVIRDKVLHELSLKPYEASWKVMLIDGADAMNLNAANCLLKTLEEPPASSVLVLVTARPDALPETILSRCHVIRFGLLAPADLETALLAQGVAAENAPFLARSSGGSISRALRMAESDELPALRRRIIQLATGVQKDNIIASSSRFTDQVSALSKDRGEARAVAEWLLDLTELFYRDVAAHQLGLADAALSNADLMDMIGAEARIRPRGIRMILDTIEEAKRLLKSNVDLDATVVDMFSRIAAFRSQRAA
jgi:DNA polymerase III subunit delta'